jgi:type II secretory ATPase GspE/PulE/Tfp pilus assembly ATPase PilB-like protein
MACREAYDPLDGELELMGIKREQLGQKKIYRAGDGCEECHGIGYSGRMGVHELMMLDDDIREVLLASQDANRIKKKAIEKGMKTLRDSAVLKVLSGLTSLEEALANTQTDDLR